MGKRRKRAQKWTVYIVKEGERREQGFYEFLYDLYQPRERDINISSFPGNGGTSSSLVKEALLRKDNYCRVFVWIDEDVCLSANIRQQLADAWNSGPFPSNVKDRDLQKIYNRDLKNPILIVSHPISCDGFLVTLCGGTIKNTLTTTQCKNAFDGLTNAKTKDDEIGFYKKVLTDTKLQQLRKSFDVLDLLLSVFENPKQGK